MARASFLGLNGILTKTPRKLRCNAAVASIQCHGLTPLGSARRYASTRQTPQDSSDKLTWQELLFGQKQNKEQDRLKEGDLRVQLEEESGSIFQRRSLTAKAALDPRLRCTEVDGNGKVIMVDGELKKSELIARVLQAGSRSSLFPPEGPLQLLLTAAP